ncbi:MAG: homoserine kinase [Christensenellaceae bacterium]|jgi:homoserine kinase|nr:homoserine kinase [Christensenellaceae bacterium]
MIHITVPASTSNVGPGFDSLGCAMALYNRFAFEELPADEYRIRCADPRFANRDNLTVVGYEAAMRYMGLPAQGLAAEIQAEVPVARGLGSSSTLIVAGAMAAAKLHGDKLTKAELLDICTQLEGHPDNLAPTIYGGFTAALLHEGKPYAVNYPLHESLRFLALIPDFETSTQEARQSLPQTTTYQDAVFNISHIAVLLRALELGDAALIRLSLNDTLHQPYRKQLIHGYDTVAQRASDCGAIAFFISGSGSTCMCLYSEASFLQRIAAAVAPLPHAWRALPLRVDHTGAKEDRGCKAAI